MLETSCFAQCGICNGDTEAIKSSYNIDPDDFYKLPVPSNKRYHGEDNAERFTTGGKEYVKSTLMDRTKMARRANLLEQDGACTMPTTAHTTLSYKNSAAQRKPPTELKYARFST